MAPEAAKGARGSPVGRVLSGAMAIIVMIVAVWIAVRELGALEPAALLHTLRSLPATALVACVGFTLASYGCLAIQEGYGLAMFHRRMPTWRIAANATIANALSSVVGFGLASGPVVRLRLYRRAGLANRTIAELALLMSLATYLSGLATLGLSVILWPEPVAMALHKSLPLTVLAAAALVAPAILWLIPIRPEQRVLTASQRAGGLAASVSDWVFSGAALFSVSGRDLADFPAFLAVFCLGSLLGSLSGVPIGLGVLEATMLTLRFDAQVHETAAALIVYRAIYFACPALAAAVALGLLQVADFGRRRAGSNAR